MFLNCASDITGLYSSVISGSFGTPFASKWLCRKMGAGPAIGYRLSQPGYDCWPLSSYTRSVKRKRPKAPPLSSALKKFSMSSAVF